MKRQNPDDEGFTDGWGSQVNQNKKSGDGGPQKRTRPIRKYTSRIIIPSDTGAVVIGRGGNVIRSIRQAYGNCKIDIPDTKGPKRVVQIDSDDHNQLADCSTEIVNSMINVAQESVPSVKKGDGLCELLINGPLVSNFNIQRYPCAKTVILAPNNRKRPFVFVRSVSNRVAEFFTRDVGKLSRPYSPNNRRYDINQHYSETNFC